MPLFGWSGPGQMREMTNERASAPTITEPSRPQVVAEHSKLFMCIAPGCGQKFRKVMILARHFNASHDALRQDKDSWRQYSQEVDE